MGGSARGANVDFFAAAGDQEAVLHFLFDSTDVRVFESYSEPEKELREFRSVAEVQSVFQLGEDPKGQGNVILLMLWSPSAMAELLIERFALDPAKCQGHTFRHKIGGGALMQLYFGGVAGTVVTKSHFGHQSQTRAENWGSNSGIDWLGLKRVSNQIVYHLRSRLAAGKARGRLVLPEAMRLAGAGYALKEFAHSSWQYSPEPIAGRPNNAFKGRRAKRARP